VDVNNKRSRVPSVRVQTNKQTRKHQPTKGQGGSGGWGGKGGCLGEKVVLRTTSIRNVDNKCVVDPGLDECNRPMLDNEYRLRMSWRFERVSEDRDSQERLESRYERTETFRVFQFQDNLCILSLLNKSIMFVIVRVV
jgi:hypothetical protein